MKNKILILACLCFLFINCKKEAKPAETATAEVEIDTTSPVVVSQDKHSSQNSVDWQGTYKGITPCADCEGIDTEIILDKELTFITKTRYLGKGDKTVFEEKGTFSWDNTGLIIALKAKNGTPYLYKVGENTLTQLDMEGKIITGDLQGMFILKKQ